MVAEDKVNTVKQYNHCLHDIKVKLCVLRGGKDRQRKVGLQNGRKSGVQIVRNASSR